MAWFQLADLALVLLVTDVSLGLAVLGSNGGPLQIILGGAMVLFLPGYALVAAIFNERPLEPLKRLVFSVACSLAVTALGGLVLNFAPRGLEPLSWSIWFGAITVVASAAALVQRLKTSTGIRPSIAWKFGAPDLALLGLAAVLIAVALNISWRPAPTQGLQAYSTLWMLPTQSGTSDVLQIGIQSSEFEVTGYKLQLLMNGQVVKEWPAITLPPGQKWESNLLLPSGSGGRRFDLNLYRLDAPTTVYRHTALTTPKSGS